MIKNYSLVFIAFLCFSLSGYGQEIFNVAGGGAFPAGWTDTNNITPNNTSISDYYLVEPGNPGDIIETASYNLSANTSATFEVDIRSYGSGTHRSLLVEVSTDGGTTFTQSYTTPNATTSFTTRTINIATVSANTVLRLSVDATSGRGIRLQDLILTGVGVGSTDTELNFASTAYTANEGDGTASICVDIINPSATPTTANVVLTSTNAPHVTYATTGITFPANSSTQQCVTVNLADNTNCGDATDYTFELQSVSGGSSASAGSDNETTLSVGDDDETSSTPFNETFSNFGTFTPVSISGSKDWEISSGRASINGYGSSGTAEDYLISASVDMSSNSVATLAFDLSDDYSGPALQIMYSTNFNGNYNSTDVNAATWTSVPGVTISSGTSSVNANVLAITGSNVYFAFYYTATGTGGGQAATWTVDNLSLNITACSIPSPEINLQGNTTNIADGNTAISTTDDTDFGDVLVGNSEAHTFTIQNTGTADLDLTTITSSNSDFVVSAYTNPTTVTDGASTTFIVTFTPTTTGTSTSTITILSNDANEATYNFNVEGNGTAIPSILLNSSNPAVAASNITDGTDDNVIYAFNLSVTTYEAELTAFNFTTSGSATNADITNFKVWYSTNSTFNAGSDTTLQTITTSLGSGLHAVTGASQTIANGSTGYIFITTDLPCGATDGRTITVNAITTGNLTFTTGNKSGTAYASGTHTITEATPNNVASLATANCENGGVDVSWTAATGCLDDYIVVTSTSPLTTSPSGNGSSYTANTTYGSGSSYDDGFVVYKGTGTSTSITALTNGTQYYYTVFTRNGNSWSSGATVNCTPNLAYCDPGSWSSGDSEIEGVVLTGENNAINNITPNTCTNTVQDNTAMSADLFDGDSYTLTVEFGECDGGSFYSGAGGVWIDWNNDGDFDDTDELIGTTTLSFSGSNLFENFTINVPSGQTLGNYRMRIIQDEGGSEASIDPCTSPGWGTIADYTIEVIASCTPTHTFTSMLPTSGPEDTEITVTGTGFTASTTASFGAVNATVDFVDATTLIVHVPAGATTNMIRLTEAGCRVQTGTFTIVSTSGTCISSSGTFTDLFISEVYDSDANNVWYVELYNPTPFPIDLDAGDYEIDRYADLTTTAVTGNVDLTGTVPAYSVFTLSLGSSANTCFNTFDININAGGINAEDRNVLTKGGVDIDAVEFPNQTGYTIRRLGTATGPTATYNAADWDLLTTEECDDIGVAPLVTYSNPNISTILDASDCTVLDYSVTATEGDSNTTGDLTYQWYFNNGVNDVWTPVTSTLPSGYTILGEDGNNLLMEGDINSLNDLANYQFYCEVTEAGSCTNVSNAIQPNYNVVTWNGSWSSFPGTNSTVVLNANYDTASGGDQISFSACSLIINNVLLSIGDGDFVEVTNDVTVNGTNGAIEIEPQGSFVQINDSGIVTATIPTNLKVSKLTAPSNNWYEYTYWSSPVFQETPANGLALSNPNRRYQYNAEYYRDSTFETANDGTATVGAGVDDIDDNGNDWGNISTTYLTPGVGYASTHNPTVFSSTPGCPGPTCRIRYTFSGLFNNGVITVPLYRNDEELGDNNWNFVGNPYPSAISADVFLATNMGLIDEEILEPNPIMGGAIYLWSQNTAPSNTANGNNGLNFSDTDYAIINGTGQTAAQENGGDSTIPNRFIPSGQGFFISMDNNATSTTVSPSPVPTQDIQTANLIFNNAMRVTGDNNQFFRPSNDANSINKLWLNLTSDNGVFSQILVGYLDHATDAYDGMYFDAPKNGVTSSHSAIYTLIPNSDKKLAIQGKNSNSLTLDEVVPLGFYTSIDVATLYTFTISQFEGAFMTENAVYINDKLLNTFHNLKNSDYTFTSEIGEFNDRFEIVFTPTILLSIDDNLINSNEVTLTELQNGDVEIKVGQTHTIKHVDIIDITGRRVYSLQGDDSTEVYNLSKLSQAAYVAKITLSNGQVISKKAIKQK
ncbi:choice-of-anchor D domain-containing protein [Winogradskyella thalassocola]|uniref:Abnormal spindle-like microcephaly-assoc'd, ASPM-SPD-2-Hydin n=1 Tax=Winogradskyella thalassocola TaxID=262004 RepID=A0A1G7W5P3_9FLAO|nr:choice-of-anchor D domain-containing protein [Winogradskyella thalassocola]SDG67273.1 Abnormal spindle-like microcephaly-assoc'd, ASPM-SPD-2-Hydin [Winogradskyella thalassocola]